MKGAKWMIGRALQQRTVRPARPTSQRAAPRHMASKRHRGSALGRGSTVLPVAKASISSDSPPISIEPITLGQLDIVVQDRDQLGCVVSAIPAFTAAAKPRFAQIVRLSRPALSQIRRIVGRSVVDDDHPDQPSHFEP